MVSAHREDYEGISHVEIGKTVPAIAALVAGGTRWVSAHGKIDYTFGGDGLRRGATRAESILEPSDELDYAVGVEAAATSRITVLFDVIGRFVYDFGQVVAPDPASTGSSFPRSNVAHVDGDSRSPVHMALGTVGLKVHVGQQWLLLGTLLFPVSDNGLKPHLTPVVGIERVFH